MPDSSPPPSALAEQLPREVVASYVRGFLLRHGIEKRSMASEVERILGSSSSHAHRKITGQSAWMDADLCAIAQHFGEQLYSIFLPQLSRGQLKLEHQSLSCGVLLGEELAEHEYSELVAVVGSPDPLVYWVFPFSKPLPGSRRFRVREVHLTPNQSVRGTIAVLDDSEEAGLSVCDNLRLEGFRADYYASADELQAAAISQPQPYDAFVIDWLLGNQTAERLIRELRSTATYQLTPICVLTGQLSSDVSSPVEAEISAVVEDFDCSYFSKPVRSMILSSELQRKIARANQAKQRNRA